MMFNLVGWVQDNLDSFVAQSLADKVWTGEGGGGGAGGREALRAPNTDLRSCLMHVGDLTLDP